MKRADLEQVLREYVREQLSEISTTAGAGGYLSKMAFSKDKRDNLATQFMKKMGFQKVERPSRPSSTKLVDYK